MSRNIVICSDVLTILGARWCRIRQSLSAIDIVEIAVDSRLIGDCSCSRYLYFDQRPDQVVLVKFLCRTGSDRRDERCFQKRWGCKNCLEVFTIICERITLILLINIVIHRSTSEKLAKNQLQNS